MNQTKNDLKLAQPTIFILSLAPVSFLLILYIRLIFNPKALSVRKNSQLNGFMLKFLLLILRMGIFSQLTYK
jgi:hypothetical protein